MAIETMKFRPSSRVLIVEDDRRLLAAMGRQVKEAGCPCVCCDNASEAMLQFAAGGIDIVVTDLTMPGVDGLSIIGLIRSQSEVPIVVVTGHADDYKTLIGRYGHVSMIRKPFEPKSFVACVQVIINSGIQNVRYCGCS